MQTVCVYVFFIMPTGQSGVTKVGIQLVLQFAVVYVFLGYDGELFRETFRLIRADCRAITSSFYQFLAFYYFLNLHSQQIASIQQKRRKATIRGEMPVRRTQTAHSMQPHMKVLEVVEVLTDLFPQPSMVVVVISYSGNSVTWLRQAMANPICLCRRLHQILQNPLTYLAMNLNRNTRKIAMRLRMAVAKKNSYPLIFSMPKTMKRTMPPTQPMILHI